MNKAAKEAHLNWLSYRADFESAKVTLKNAKARVEWYEEEMKQAREKYDEARITSLLEPKEIVN